MTNSIRTLARRFLLLLITLMAAVGISTLAPSTAHALASYDIWVSGEQVDGLNADDVLEDGGSVRFESDGLDRGTLIIDSARIKVGRTDASHAAGIFIGSDMQNVDIEFIGDSTITLDSTYDPDTFSAQAGIISWEKDTSGVQIYSSGDATLTIDMNNTVSGHSTYGIWTSYGLSCYDLDISMNLRSPSGITGITTTFYDVNIIRSSVTMDIADCIEMTGVSPDRDLNMYASSLIVRGDTNTLSQWGAYGIYLGGSLYADHGSHVFIQTNDGGTYTDCSGIKGGNVYVTDNSMVSAFAGESEDSYGIRGASGSGTYTVSIDDTSVLSASGYASAIQKSGTNIPASTLALGADANSQPTSAGAFIWDGNKDLREYKYVCIPPGPRLTYRAGIEGSSTWQNWVDDASMAGTSGKSLRMEGFELQMYNEPFYGKIEYRAQLQTEGWQGWKQEGQTAGYAPKDSTGKRLEAMEIRLTDDLSRHYDVWYHLQVQRFGWMGWAKNGEPAGTVGYAFRVEAIEVMLMPKGASAPSVGHSVATPEANMLSLVRCRSYDNKTWQGPKGEGDVSGTRGQKKTCVRVGLAASSFSAAGINKGDSYIQVSVYQNGKWSAWSSADDQEVGSKNGKPITGIKARIAPGTTLASQYDLYYRVEVRESSKACWLGWAKNGAIAGQSNLNLEQLEFSLVKKGNPAPPSKASQLKNTVEHAKQRWVIERWPCNWPKPSYRF